MRSFSHVCARLACLIVVLAVAPAEASANRMDRVERTVIRKVNALRAADGLPALAGSRRLARAADAHSRDMLRAQFFSHTSSNGQSAYDRVLSYRRASMMGETLAYMPTQGDHSARNIVDMWMASPPHRATLLTGGLRRIGVSRRTGTLYGRSVVMWTADLTSAR